MNTPDLPTAPGRIRRRTTLRHALIRWLGGMPIASPPAEPSSDATHPPPGEAIPIPARSPGQLLLQARYYFDQAESLNLRGVPELAAAFYRQAYALMNASLQGEDLSLREDNISTAELEPQFIEDFPSEGPEKLDSDSSDERPTSTSKQGPQPEELIEARPVDDRESPVSASPTPLPDPIEQLAALRQQLSKTTAAQTLEQLEAWHEQGYHHAGLDHLKGMALLMLGKSREAEGHFRQALQRDPNHFRSLVNLSGILLGLKQHEEPAKLLQHALTQVAPDSVEAVPALTNLSIVHEMAGRSMESAQLILQVHRLKPGHIRPARVLQASRTLEEMGDDPDAIELLSWLREHHEPSEDVLRRLAELLERRGEFQEAALVYRELMSGATGVASS